MLVHICCSVDSHYFLKRLKDDFTDEVIEAFFYDPNIHPYSEYLLRLEDVKYSCKKLGIKLYEGKYDLDSWFNIVKGYENEPERGYRCNLCYKHRLEVTLLKAIELGHHFFTTTLLISPLKSQEKLNHEASILEDKYKKFNIKWIFKDYRSGNGVHIQAKEVKSNNLYRQNYCGCMYALSMQREMQNIYKSELINPITNQILPNSIQERLQIYKLRNEFEAKNKKYKIYKKNIQNYRLLSGGVKLEKKMIPSYIIFYSRLKPKIAKVRIEFEMDKIYYMNKNEIKMISLDTFNKKLNTNYINIYQILQNPPILKDELRLRDSFDLSVIIVLEQKDIMYDKKYEIKIDSVIYEDTQSIIEEII